MIEKQNGNRDAYMTKFRSELQKILRKETKLKFIPKNIGIVCSQEFMVAGQFAADIANELSDTPTSVSDDLRTPGWFGKGTLAILMFSENEIENLNTLICSIRKTGSTIVLITDFDMMHYENILKKIKITSKDRFAALGETVGNLVLMFDDMKLISKKEITNALSWTDGQYPNAQEIVKNCDLNKTGGKRIMISHPHNLRSTARLWKMIFSEDFGRTALFTEYPEFNHNEIVGWCMSPDQSEKFINIFIQEKETGHIIKVISECQIKVLKDDGSDVLPVGIPGKNVIEKNLMGFLIAELGTVGDGDEI